MTKASLEVLRNEAKCFSEFIDDTMTLSPHNELEGVAGSYCPFPPYGALKPTHLIMLPSGEEKQLQELDEKELEWFIQLRFGVSVEDLKKPSYNRRLSFAPKGTGVTFPGALLALLRLEYSNNKAALLNFISNMTQVKQLPTERADTLYSSMYYSGSIKTSLGARFLAATKVVPTARYQISHALISLYKLPDYERQTILKFWRQYTQKRLGLPEGLPIVAILKLNNSLGKINAGVRNTAIPILLKRLYLTAEDASMPATYKRHSAYVRISQIRSPLGADFTHWLREQVKNRW